MKEHGKGPQGGNALTDAVVSRLPRSQAAEAFRLLQANMGFEEADPKGLWLVTSPSGPEGKSTVVTNLALTLAAAGRRTLAVDANLRQPALHRLLGGQASPGLLEALAAPQEPLSRRIQPLSPNLHLLAAGTAAADYTAALQRSGLEEIMAAAAKQYDTVLVDTPPLLTAADTKLLARHCQRAILVVRVGYTRKEALQEAEAVLQRSGLQRTFIVLNQVPPRHSTRSLTAGFGLD